jgi:hypothetical protein
MKFGLATLALGSAAADHPTLPTRWIATTMEPGVGVGVEAYKFVDKPTDENPSALWSNYSDTGCQRLLWAGGYEQDIHYLFGCDAVDCCYEDEEGNQLEFQIPNVHARKEPEVNHTVADVKTAFETVASADVWSWSYHPPLLKPFTQTWKAYTTNAGPDDSTLVLHRWDVATPFAANFSIANIDFTNFTHVAAADQPAFDASFTRPTKESCRLRCGDALRTGKLSQRNYELLHRPTLLKARLH